MSTIDLRKEFFQSFFSLSFIAKHWEKSEILKENVVKKAGSVWNDRILSWDPCHENFANLLCGRSGKWQGYQKVSKYFWTNNPAYWPDYICNPTMDRILTCVSFLLWVSFPPNSMKPVELYKYILSKTWLCPKIRCDAVGPLKDYIIWQKDQILLYIRIS